MMKGGTGVRSCVHCLGAASNHCYHVAKEKLIVVDLISIFERHHERVGELERWVTASSRPRRVNLEARCYTL
jgi:hypothetical protein